MPPRLSSQPRTVALVTVAAAAALAAVQLACLNAGIDMAVVTRDAAAVARQPWYVGVVSNLGLAVWGGAIAIGLLGWRLLRVRPAQQELSRTLAGFAALSIVLAADDNLQIHELFFPAVLGVKEHYAFVLYAALAGAWGLRFRRVLLERAPVAMVIAAAGFAGSILSDEYSQVFDQRFLYVAEDGLKLIGILNWTLAAGIVAASGVREALAASGIADAVAASGFREAWEPPLTRRSGLDSSVAP